MTFAIGTPLGEIERRVIHATLGHVGGDKRLCAQLLGIATRTIYRRLEEEKEGTPTEGAGQEKEAPAAEATEGRGEVTSQPDGRNQRV
jgi:two-component system response regulator HydG